MTLGLRSIYVIPSHQGCWFLLMFAVIWLLGTNYQNNLILGTAFLLLGIFLVSIFHAFFNLAGLRFEAVAGSAVFAAESAAFTISVSGTGERRYRNVTLCLASAPKNQVAIDLLEQRRARVQLFQPMPQRGKYPLDRILVETRYPFGLIRAWAWIRLDADTIVYPTPYEAEHTSGDAAGSESGGQRAQIGGEDFFGFASYQPGAPLSQVAWKHYARGAGLHLKEFAHFYQEQSWIDWQDWSGFGDEQRLSAMCARVIALSDAGHEFGMRLPGKILTPDSGETHRTNALTALALFNFKSDTIGHD